MFQQVTSQIWHVLFGATAQVRIFLHSDWPKLLLRKPNKTFFNFFHSAKTCHMHYHLKESIKFQNWKVHKFQLQMTHFIICHLGVHKNTKFCNAHNHNQRFGSIRRKLKTIKIKKVFLKGVIWGTNMWGSFVFERFDTYIKNALVLWNFPRFRSVYRGAERRHRPLWSKKIFRTLDFDVF